MRRFWLSMALIALTGCFNDTSYIPFIASAAQQLVTASSTVNVGTTVLILAGDFFSPGDTVYWNGKAQTTLYKAPGELDATLDPNLTDSEGTAQVNVVNADGVSSNAVTVTVKEEGVSVLSFSPPSANPGDGPLTLTVDGSGFPAGSQILWNGVALATTRVSGARLTATVSAALLANTGSAIVQVQVPCCSTFNDIAATAKPFSIGESAVTVVRDPTQSVGSVAVVDLVWDKTRARLYGTTGGDPGLFWTINPVDASAVSSTGSAFTLAISDGDQFLYGMVRSGAPANRFTLPDLTNPTTISNVVTVVPAPGAPSVSAMILNSGQIGVADGLSLRPSTIASSFNGPQTPVWGADSSTLYVQNGFGTVQRFAVDAGGVNTHPTTVTNNLAGALFFDATLHRLYGTGGSNLDEQGNSHGTFALPVDRFGQAECTASVADGAVGKVFFTCLESFGVTVRSYDAGTSVAIGVLVLPTATQDIHKIVRWGTNGLAVSTGSQLVLYSGAFVH